MMELEQITFGYRRSRAVYRDFSLSFPKGRIYGLLGKNGAGKSTLLYIMSGLLTPQKGRVSLDGVPVMPRVPSVLSELFLLPEVFTLPAVSLSEYVRMNAPFYPRFSRETLRTNLDIFGLDEQLHLGELSMGQRKKVYIAFALAANTTYLLMDEPSNGLDIPSKNQFRRAVASAMDGERTVIISTHQVRDVDMLLDHVVLVDQSRVLLDRRVSEVCERLCFEERPVGEAVEDALYAQPSVSGNSVVRRNLYAEDTPLNLELLFQVVLANPERIQQVFQDGPVDYEDAVMKGLKTE